MSPFRGFFGSPPPPPSDGAPPPPAAPDWAALFDLLEEGVVAVGPAKRVLLANRSVAPLLGRPAGEAIGKPLWEILRHREITDMMDRTMAGGPGESGEMPMTTPGERLFRVTAAPFAAFDGRGVLLTFADLTQTRRLESARKDFVANVSHELKTPLTALRASLDTLLEGALEDKDHARDFLSTAIDQVDRLHRLIEELLTLSRLEKTGAPPATAVCDPSAVARRVLSALTPVAKKFDVTLDPLAASPGVSAPLSEDELSQVLMNLCDNAIKFNRPGGRVAVSVSNENGRVVITVRDTGVGVSFEDQPRVFERFYRADKARSKDTGGSGLGLAIVKHLVENRAGTVHLESRPGEGSVFVVSFLLP